MDILVLVILAITILAGLYRGFIKEMFGIISLILSLYLTKVAAPLVRTEIFFKIESDFIGETVAYVATFAFFFTALAIVTAIVTKISQIDKPSVSNRLFGALLGGAKGYLFCLVIYFIIYSFSSVLHPEYEKTEKFEDIEEISPEWLKKSKTYSLFFGGIVTLDKLIYSALPEKPKKTECEAVKDGVVATPVLSNDPKIKNS